MILYYIFYTKYQKRPFNHNFQSTNQIGSQHIFIQNLRKNLLQYNKGTEQTSVVTLGPSRYNIS